VRTPLVEKQIADQAKVHGIAESDVVEKIMLTEASSSVLSRPTRSRPRGLARVAQGGHGDGRELHDGRRLDGAMTRASHRWLFRSGATSPSAWDAEDPAAPTILAIHGVTSSHLAWEFLAESLPGCGSSRRTSGRGRSNEIAGPAGMAAHADDLAAVSAAFDLGPVVVVAHSMGAFVAVASPRGIRSSWHGSSSSTGTAARRAGGLAPTSSSRRSWAPRRRG
jgi:hypothetical protein